MKKDTFHIIWNTYKSYPVWDNQGDWNKLKEMYTQLQKDNVDFEVNKNFPTSYRKVQPRQEQICIDEEEVEFLKESIIQLTKPNGDRIAGDLKLIHLKIQETYIELIVEDNKGVLKQKLARLKSRLATLMSFKKPEKYKGSNTWGKGIWISVLNSNIPEAIEVLRK